MALDPGLASGLVTDAIGWGGPDILLLVIAAAVWTYERVRANRADATQLRTTTHPAEVHQRAQRWVA